MTEESGDRVRIIGFGSLLSLSSATRSFPSLSDWRLVRLPLTVRIFGHAAPVFFERGLATARAPYEFASLCAEPSAPTDAAAASQMLPRAEPILGESSQFALDPSAARAALDSGRFIFATAFTIPSDGMAEFQRRELEFTHVSVQPFHAEAAEPDGAPAVMCARGSDALLRERLGGEGLEGARAWEAMVGRHGIDTLWGHEWGRIFPARAYLRLCVLAAERFGPEVRENFLRTTFLADRVTSVGAYLEAHPDILTTEPPENVRLFYTL